MLPDFALPIRQAAAGEAGARDVLFLAQLPPPLHGQSAMAAAVRDVMTNDAGIKVVHRWGGGARELADVGHRTIAKYLAFARMLGETVGDWIAGRRYRLAYLGMAPWAHTAMRDALVASAAKLVARRVLVHIHGDGVARIMAGHSVRDRLLRAFLRRTELIAITGDVCDTARRSGIFSRVHLVANVVKDPGKPVMPRKGPITITCLGNLDPRKGVFDFVEIVAALAKRGLPVRGMVLGAQTAALGLDELRHKIAELGAEDFVQAAGRVDEAQKALLLSQSDVFLYLSRHDLAPLALLEAMAHGLAPIVFNIGGLREMVGPELDGNVLDPALTGPDLEAAVDALVSAYLGDRSRLERDRGAARARYLQAYTPECFAGRLCAIASDSA